MPTRPRPLGFTIIELMVTLTILGLMLFLVNHLFNDTSRAVTTSVQASKTIAQSRSINEQLTLDADAMVGPDSNLANEGGYIVIIQQRLLGVPMLDPQTLAEVPNPVTLRSDQLLFIRDTTGSGLRSMTPKRADRYGTDLAISSSTSPRAKVWYGHVQRTEPNGTPRTGANTGLGQSAAGADRIGSNLILGRQAMLFNPPGLVTASDVYADTAYYLSPVRNFVGAPASPQSYKGFTDVTALSYSTLVTQLTNGTDDAFPGSTDNGDYLATAYPNANQRLHVNPAPDATDTNYASWAIAQSHPILAQSCSEIIIDFAADLNGNGRIDRQRGGDPTPGTGDTTGPIFWYDALANTNFGTGTGQVQWRQQSPATDFIQPWNSVNLGPNARAFIFRVDDAAAFSGTLGTPGSEHSYWPYMIRIRYRLHDTRGRLTSNEPSALRDGLDNDGDSVLDETGEDRISGRWFERIISVPRP